MTEVTLRKQTAYRLPSEQRLDQVSTLIGGLASLTGGAKQAVHYTDLTPAVVFLAVTNNGNNPFYRFPNIFNRQDDTVMTAYGGDFLSDIYVGWAQCLHFKAGTRSKVEIATWPLNEG